ncbi:MAG: HRDC domain-containing protein, partial [Fimbriimonadales bacterium]
TWKRNRTNYREVLDAEDFAVFAKLREIRKAIAQAEGVPVYTIFTNEQLAQIVQARASTESALEQVVGVGDGRTGPTALPSRRLLRRANRRPGRPVLVAARERSGRPSLPTPMSPASSHGQT